MSLHPHIRQVFARCACGPDEDRHRIAFCWSGDNAGPAGPLYVGFMCSARAAEALAVVNATEAEFRPSFMVRVKPHPWVVAMVDRIGQPVQ